MRTFLVVAILLVCGQAFADEGKMIMLKDGSRVLRIEVGSDRANSREMVERIRQLEEAVYYLQNRVYDLEHQERVSKPSRDKEWSCSIEAMGERFIGIGETKAIAQKMVMDECTAKQNNSFFCQRIECSK